MKKIFFSAIVMMACALCASAANVATFENVEGGINIAHADTCWQGADAPVLGKNNFVSGDYTFAAFTNDYEGWIYYNGFTVTNETSNGFNGWEYYRSAKGGAYEGDNFAVWSTPNQEDSAIVFNAQIVPGFFINNSAYAVNSMCNGDKYAKKFTAEDWFKLTIIGYKNNEEQGSLDFYLANEGKYISEWAYVDLSELGEIDAIKFALSSTDNGMFGMNTPAYFCMDNFGAEKPEGYVEPEATEFPEAEEALINTNAAVKAVKAVRNGQVVIIRGNKAFNVLGAEL